MLRHLRLTEFEPPRVFDLTASEAEALSTTELAVISRSPGSAGWQVAAGAKVGAARVGDLQVTVHPKISMDRLVFMMGYARRPTFWRDQAVRLDPEAQLADALAESFRRLAGRAVEQGLLHGYQEVEEALPVVRGRIRLGNQIARRFGLGLPLEVSYDDFTVDIAENRLLLTASLRLLGLPNVSKPVRQALQRLRLQLSDVTPLTAAERPPAWIPSRLNTRYQPALRLAELILAGDSFEQRVGELMVSGFVLDMWRIYEDFVCVALKNAMTRFGGRTYLQRQLHLDRDARVEMRPDLVWNDHGGRCVVVDAKYKAEKQSGFPNADLYQMLAYCTVLGLAEGHLIYAEGNEQRVSHTVLGAGVRIHSHALDLAAQPEVVLRQIEELAVRMVESQGPDDRFRSQVSKSARTDTDE